MTLLVLLSVKFCFNLQSVVKKKEKKRIKLNLFYSFIYLSIAIFFKNFFDSYLFGLGKHNHLFSQYSGGDSEAASVL